LLSRLIAVLASCSGASAAHASKNRPGEEARLVVQQRWQSLLVTQSLLANMVRASRAV
jgi:hypothetical protein